jgi:hypothetical protein
VQCDKYDTERARERERYLKLSTFQNKEKFNNPDVTNINSTPWKTILRKTWPIFFLLAILSYVSVMKVI